MPGDNAGRLRGVKGRPAPLRCVQLLQAAAPVLAAALLLAQAPTLTAALTCASGALETVSLTHADIRFADGTVATAGTMHSTQVNRCYQDPPTCVAAGKVYSTCATTHPAASSTMEWQMPALPVGYRWTRFTAFAGICEPDGGGSVKMGILKHVAGAGAGAAPVQRWGPTPVGSSTTGVPIDVDISDAASIVLVVDSDGSHGSDHATWFDGLFERCAGDCAAGYVRDAQGGNACVLPSACGGGRIADMAAGQCVASCPAGQYGAAASNTCVACAACHHDQVDAGGCAGKADRVCTRLPTDPAMLRVVAKAGQPAVLQFQEAPSGNASAEAEAVPFALVRAVHNSFESRYGPARLALHARGAEVVGVTQKAVWVTGDLRVSGKVYVEGGVVDASAAGGGAGRRRARGTAGDAGEAGGAAASEGASESSSSSSSSLDGGGPVHATALAGGAEREPCGQMHGRVRDLEARVGALERDLRRALLALDAVAARDA